MKTIKRDIVEEVPYGVYVWEMPDGRWVGDDEGNFLSIASMKHDQKRIEELTYAVRGFGVESGKPLFLSGHRKISDEEYATQLLRHKWGLLPDEYDVPALKEELRYRKEYND